MLCGAGYTSAVRTSLPLAVTLGGRGWTRRCADVNVCGKDLAESLGDVVGLTEHEEHTPISPSRLSFHAPVRLCSLGGITGGMLRSGRLLDAVDLR
jgi:hypothetical protein